ncbi:glutaredoxin-related protein 5, mitochondrial [Musca domestica]|uniref:Glutaredoxin-related protein 5, mitochondrial n=1 Tax=Musca domestica TaxID=7370 RepID=A0A9J7CNL7_MUSDO|nr:glutaredoxin-related protein 5, mitochondrial [Musca domestica]
MAGLIRQVFRSNFTQRLPAALAQSHRFFSAEGNAPQTFTKEVLQKLVNTNKVVVFMKGNPEAPRCGFSNAVVQILRMHGVQYDAHDVLQSDELREKIKEFSEWPTIPQVFINGEFVGGCDILLQMHQSGDLIEELKKVGIESLLLQEANETDNKKEGK